jgi:hypothetical protein
MDISSETIWGYIFLYIITANAWALPGTTTTTGNASSSSSSNLIEDHQ